MKCIECNYLDNESSPSHNKIGFGQCKAKPVSGYFVNINREQECSDYKRANEGVVIKRMAWFEQLNLKVKS